MTGRDEMKRDETKVGHYDGEMEEVCASSSRLDDIVEEAARELGLDLLLDPPVRGEVCRVRSVR